MSSPPNPNGRKTIGLNRELWIVDPDREYAHRLARALQSELRCPCTIRIRDLRSLRESAPRGPRPDVLILGEAAESPASALLPGVPRLRKGGVAAVLKGDADLCYGMRVGEIARKVEEKIHGGSRDGISLKPLILLYSFSRELRKHWLQSFFYRQKKQGRPAYYIPFAPAYEVSLPLCFGRGPELSSLLLLLSAGGTPRADGLGPCFEAQRQGYYALRTGGGPEDLNECETETQKELFRLFRAFIRARSEPSVLVVECAQLPFRRLKVLAGMADVFVCDSPAGTAYAQRAARAILDRTLAQLPESVRFLELNAPLPLREKQA